MIAHCTKCHHEWQVVVGEITGREALFCGWCGAPGKKIGEDYADEPRPPDPTRYADWRKNGAGWREKP